MYRGRGEDRRRSVTEEDLTEIYGGPTEFMEAGTRGFLVTTLPKKEEFAVDDAIDLLRQTAVKVYGGYKPKYYSKKLDRLGYIKVNCLNLDEVKVWPHPGNAEEEKKEADEETARREGRERENAEKMEEGAKGEGTEESKDKGEEDSAKDKDKAEKGEAEDKKEEEEEDIEKKEEAKRLEDEKKTFPPRMHSIHKFKAYRTEMRNTMFIKSDVPDPMLVAEEAMELVIARNSVTGDSVCQLLPVIGVCQFDYQQLEVMTRRCLSHLFDESLEPVSYALMLVDKLSEPGSEVVFEIVRNAIWAINPMAWLSSPICEPDLVLRFELIGSKLVLSVCKQYMKLRQYRPVLLVDMGPGEAEEDDGGWMSEEAKRQLEEKRKEREKQKEIEKKKEEERQKERARKMEEAEARRKAREERREREKKEKGEKGKSGGKGDKDSKKEESSGAEAKTKTEEGTPPSKKQKTEEEEDDDATEEENEEEKQEETPPSKRQRVDSKTGSKEEEEEDSQEKMEGASGDESEDTPSKTPTKQRVSRRGTRAGKKVKARMGLI